MSFFSTMSRGINNGLAALANLGTAIGARMPGYLHLDPPPPYVEEDLEMNLLGDNEEEEIVGAYRISPAYHVPTQSTNLLTRFITAAHSVSLPRMWPPRRPRFILDLDELVVMCVMIWIIIILIILGLKPPKIGSVGFWKRDLEISQAKTLLWLAPEDKHTSSVFTSSVYSPGFYTIPDVLPPIECKDCTASTFTKPTNSHATDTKNHKRAVIPANVSEAHDNMEYEGPFHHAYPVHAGRVHNSDQVSRIKTQLERCADGLVKKLHRQALEVTPMFEFALHDCKSAIDFALLTLYPPENSPRAFTNTSLNCSVSIYGVVPGQKRTADSHITALDIPAIQNGSNHTTDNSTLNDCSRNFCDWMTLSNLGRCYHRNETEYKKNGQITYTNDSVDDFKDDAPLECNLCLPTTDQKGIDDHCKDIEAAERRLVKYLLVTFGSLGFVTLVGVLVKVSLRRPRGITRGPVVKRAGLKRKRVPVLPAACASAISVRGGHLDKRFIGKPVLISRLVDGLEGAFENPRAAPLPPSA